ncbi:TonB-dependent receptor domain-containing protein [Haloferula sargassicola]|uniref:Vitamin B12 transporter BtuB n=1 Tax=Haloferula sargassicola TaxID=490096 RepID=A0ABP9UY52_9BACT
MNSFLIAIPAALAGFLPFASLAQTEGRLDPLVFDAGADPGRWNSTDATVPAGNALRADGADLFRSLPGVSAIRNGPQTGIAQIRGLSGDRVRVQVDGQTITPACPNHMDPPLHYAQVAEGDLVEAFAGITPVSAGGDSIAGTIRLSRPDPEFGSRFGGDLGASYRGDHDAFGFTARLFDATDEVRADYRGEYLDADDLRFPGGTVRASGYETQRHTIIGSWNTGSGFIEVDAGVSSTRDAGAPALPMDMVRDDSWHLGLRQKQRFAWGTLETRAYVHEIDHLMDNFSLRPAAMRMQAPAESRDYGISSSIETGLAGGLLRGGVDLHRGELEAQQVNAMGQVRDTFRDNRRTRYGLFGEWEKPWTDTVETLVGLRGDFVETGAGRVFSQFGGPVVAADVASFNAGKREHSDLLVDAMAALRWQAHETTRIDFALGLKNRAPSLIERYLYSPSNASAGLADGRTYLGNPALDPESALMASVGIHHRQECWEVSLTPFYQSVRDFIEGRPHPTRTDTAGRPVLQFQNLDRAELYGAELAFHADLTERFALRANASWTRGRDTASGDALYRIAPLSGLGAIDYNYRSWEASLECEWATAQSDVSRLHSELKTPGYAVFHLRAAREFENGVRVEAGIENLLDHRYVDHLGGINRVAGSDVAVGARIPNAGRFAYTSIGWSF